MSTATVETRDLDVDLVNIESFRGKFIVGGYDDFEAVANVVSFAAASLIAWPYAIRRAQKTEQENDRLRDELDMLRRELSQQNSGCYD